MSVQPFAHPICTSHVALQLSSCCVMLYVTLSSSSASMATLYNILYLLVHGNISGAAKFHPNTSDDILATWSISPGSKAMNHVCCNVFPISEVCSFAPVQHFCCNPNKNCSLALQAMSLWAHRTNSDNTMTNPAGLVNTHLTTHMSDYQAMHFWPVSFF